MPPLLLTMVRHGESVDNLTALWAGHRDAPLTNHGFNQSLRLGQHFKEVPITAIYTSDLKRAHTTALNLHSANLSTPVPPFTISPLLREQFFGAAEGQPWDAGAFSSAHLPWEDHRAFRLAESAESLDEVGQRAMSVVRHFLAPHVLRSATGEQEHVVVVAHGIFLSELMFALKRAGEGGDKARFIKTTGYTNTGWSRVEIWADPEEVGLVRLAKGEGNAVELPERHEALPPPFPETVPLPTLRHTVKALNQVEHLRRLERQKGGIGSAGHDPRQKSLKDFFGGGGA